jgi:DNA-binding NtrC family response regulator
MKNRKAHTHVLVVDDEAGLRMVLSNEIEDFGYHVSQANSGIEAIEMFKKQSVDICVLDLKMPGMDGLEALVKLKAIQPLTEVIMITGHGTMEAAIEALKKGAYDFVTKPCPLDELELLIEKALEKRTLSERAHGFTASTQGMGPIYLGDSEAMMDAMNVLKKAARTDVPILITGDSGTGKELFAREAHRLSPFAKGPIVAINCGALQANLVESTLFGHERGSFTGAERRKKGLVELAENGTLFLDEVGELPLDIQVKILRFTQFGEFQRVGGDATLHVQTRLIAATSIDFETAIEKGAFRSDLYYRLNTIHIKIPSLRERKDDIVTLATCLLDDLIKKGRPHKSLSKEALEEMKKYHWPGNVRELKSTVDRLSILTDGKIITAKDIRRYVPNITHKIFSELLPLKVVEQQMILRALDHFDGDKTKAASALQVSVKTLYNKLKSYNQD